MDTMLNIIVPLFKYFISNINSYFIVQVQPIKMYEFELRLKKSERTK